MAFKILSIDGGGIRGIIPGQILVSLEEKIKIRTGNKNARIGDYFDMFAGTSTGAILSSAYICPDDNGNPKYSALDVVNLYLDYGFKVFHSSIWRKLKNLGGLNGYRYSSKGLDKLLNDTFQNKKLSDLLKSTCFISYDINKRKIILFTQHRALKKQYDFLIKDMLRGSSAAPTYFSPVKVHPIGKLTDKHILIDGGIVANDPTLCAYSEAIKFDGVEGINDMVILSLGTGKENQTYSFNDAKSWGLIEWSKPIVDIALEGGPQMTEYHMGKIASTVNSPNFFRIQPDLYEADTALDNASQENINNLKKAGIINSIKYDAILNTVVDRLIGHEVNPSSQVSYSWRLS